MATAPNHPFHNAGARFRQAVTEESPLQVIGTINAYCAMMATQAGFRAIYLSGAGLRMPASDCLTWG